SAFRRDRSCSHQIQRAFFLADGSRTSRDLVFGSAHDASASGGPYSPQTRGGCLSALHPLLQRALVARTHSQDRGIVRRALRRSLRDDGSCPPDDLESFTPAPSEARF